MGIVTLTTDFGGRDGYVACMKGVMLRVAPALVVVDVTHQIERHNILHGAFVLRQVLEWYPPGSVHLIVVDPGVGTSRRILAAQAGDQLVVAPDNGLLSLLHHDGLLRTVCVVENPRLRMARVSATFHGRDIMAPAAAHLAMGKSLGELGPATDHVEVLRLARAERLPDGSLRGRIIHRDAFGNLITNITVQDLVRLGGAPHVHLGSRDLGPLRQTYADVPAGAVLALVGSDGHLEIAANAASAWELLKPDPDAEVRLH